MDSYEINSKYTNSFKTHKKGHVMTDEGLGSTEIQKILFGNQMRVI